MSLSEHIRTLGRGPSYSRNLTRAEAADAMTEILSGRASPEATGALLMLMRYHGENAEEIAGFAEAMRQALDGWSGVDVGLDWPTYAAGRSRGLPWFLLAARLVALAGVPVLMHGWNSHQNPVASVTAALKNLDIAQVHNAKEAQNQLEKSGIAYAPLASLLPKALDLLKLRDVLGLRSAVNTTLRMLNPCAANASVQGVFHPSYRMLQADAGRILGQENISVIKGGGGEFERAPGKSVNVFGLAGSCRFETIAAPISDETGRLADISSDPDDLLRLWDGSLKNPQAKAVVIGTAALALHCAQKANDIVSAEKLATEIWHSRLQVHNTGIKIA